MRLGWSAVGRLERTDALDDACSEAFPSINSEAGSDDFWVWLPCLMITGQANRQSFKSPLAGSHHSVGACDMPDHQKLTTRVKYAAHLVDCCSGVRDAAEGQGADDGIEPVTANGRCWASASMRVTSMPSSAALPRAISSMAGLKSIPVSWIPRG